MRIAFCRSPRRAAAVGCAIVLVLWAGAGSQPASAAAGPLAAFRGHWTGTGTMREGDKTERIRCNANYRPLGSSGHEVDLELRCESDTYKFDLSGEFQADETDHLSGRWNERTRNMGGSAIGLVRGDRLQLHVESPGFSADMTMVTRGRLQSVSIDAHGGGRIVKASITLRQR